MTIRYNAKIFQGGEGLWEAEFPSLDGCVTFGNNFEEALANAEDVLALYLINCDLAIKDEEPVDGMHSIAYNPQIYGVDLEESNK